MNSAERTYCSPTSTIHCSLFTALNYSLPVFPYICAMNYLTTENLTKSFADEYLFKDLTLGISKGQKVALVAANGTGKTTLMKILAGKEIQDAGTVTFRKGITIGFLEQEPDLNDDDTIWETLFKAENAMMTAVREYELLIEDHGDQELLQKAMDKMDAMQAWDYEARVKQVLGKLGIHHLTQKINELSGGQRKRVAMARVLIEEPELLIMDEPTNHLDLQMIEWLEDYLIDLNKTILLVTHDRYFLENVCNEIYELDNGKLYTYKGNYSYFLEKKNDREERENTELGKAKNLYRKELEWMRKMPRARGTKAKSRVDAFYKVEEKAKQNFNEQQMTLAIKMSRLGSKILEARHLNMAYGDKKIIRKFTYVFKKGDRVGIVGPNGTGKTTLLRLLMGQIEPDTGNVEMGETVVFGYYSQDGLKLKTDIRIIDYVKSFADSIPYGNKEHLTASQFLTYFQFPPAKQHTFISKLSGGERRRLHLLAVLIKNPNFLILDEPTNDLDILSLNTLEDFLSQFGGVLVIVSHDRYFMDKLVDHLFVFEGEGVISDYPGNYSDYRTSLALKEQKDKQEEKAKQSRANEINQSKDNFKKKAGFKEKHEFANLEKEIVNLEAKRDALTAQLTEGKGSHNDFANWSKELDATMKSLEAKTERWIELADLLEP